MKNPIALCPAGHGWNWKSVRRIVVFGIVGLMSGGALSVWAQETVEGDVGRPAAAIAEGSDDAAENLRTASRFDSESPSEAEPPWELRPYRVLVSLAVEQSPALLPGTSERLQQELDQRITGLLASYWQTHVESNNRLAPATDALLERLSADELAERFDASVYDKVFLLTIAHERKWHLAGCEWDRTSHSRGAILRRTVVDRRLITASAVELLLDLFRPLARIDVSDAGVAEMRSRGGELLAPGAMTVTFQSGDLLLPYYRYFDRDQSLRRVQAVPWTYLRVREVSRSRMTAAVESAFAAPLVGNRRRVELIAIRARLLYPATRLRLSLQGSLTRPLVGARVRVYEHLPTEEQPNPEMYELMSDRFGRVEISQPAGDSLRRLVVHSGGAVLANVPFVPGLVRDASMPLPDDSSRLQAEGSLAIVQGELIDLVARRSVMLARALSLAQKAQWQQADEMMAAIEQQPSIASFKSRVLAIRVPAVEKARQNRDRSAEARIVAMCRQMEELVERYLDRDPVRETAAEINDLRALSQRAQRRE